MSRTVIAFFAFCWLITPAFNTPQDPLKYVDLQLIEQLTHTLPEMAPEFRALDIEVTAENYTWPAEAALHPKGLKLLEKHGFGPLKREGLMTITRTYFFMNYDSLDQKRQEILSSTQEQINENPYLTEEQKHINLRLHTRELGLSKDELGQKVSEQNIRDIRPYSLIIRKMWEEIAKEERSGN